MDLNPNFLSYIRSHSRTANLLLWLQPPDYAGFNLLNDALKVRLIVAFLLLIAFDPTFLSGFNSKIPLMLLLGATLYGTASLIMAVGHLMTLNFSTLTFLVTRIVCVLSLVNVALGYV